MGNFIRQAAAVAAIFSPVMRWIVMKKDKELPWVVRIARWAFLAFGIYYGALIIAEKAKEVLG